MKIKNSKLNDCLECNLANDFNFERVRSVTKDKTDSYTISCVYCGSSTNFILNDVNNNELVDKLIEIWNKKNTMKNYLANKISKLQNERNLINSKLQELQKEYAEL